MASCTDLDIGENGGNYTAKDGKLCLSDGLSAKPDPAVYETYTLEGDTLTIDAGSADEGDDNSFYPMVFKKTN